MRNTYWTRRGLISELAEQRKLCWASIHHPALPSLHLTPLVQRDHLHPTPDPEHSVAMVSFRASTDPVAAPVLLRSSGWSRAWAEWTLPPQNTDQRHADLISEVQWGISHTQIQPLTWKQGSKKKKTQSILVTSWGFYLFKDTREWQTRALLWW